METFKTIAAYLGMIGVPSIFVMTSWCVKSCISFFKQLKILQEAQKAQMRGQLMDRYYVIKDRGFIWSDEVDEWINQYESYHTLKGPNSVLDSRKLEILKMPVKVR